MNFLVLQRLLGAALLLCLGSCSNIRVFQHEVALWGAYDGAGAADLIYFELRNVQGVQHSGLNALTLPEDWTQRPAVADSDGCLHLEPPVQPRWTSGRSAQPEAGPGERAGLSQDEQFDPRDRSRLEVPVIAEASVLDAAFVDAAYRLSQGASAYALVAGTDDPERSPKDFRLFGARLTGAGDVEWVQLMALSFEDSRCLIGRGLDVPLRQYPVVDMALLTAALVWPVFFFI